MNKTMLRCLFGFILLCREYLFEMAGDLLPMCIQCRHDKQAATTVQRLDHAWRNLYGRVGK